MWIAPPRLVVAALWVLFAVVVSGPAAAAEPARAREYEVKAVFLFHFTRFVEWPAESFPAPDAPFAACVLGDDPFGAAIDEALRGETVDKRPVVVRRPAAAADARGCQLLFVSRQEDPAVVQGVPGVREGTVLVVGETADILAHGALIRFVVRGERVRLEVSSPALRRSRLKVSSKLLRLAEMVTPEPP